jgi:hypothetical protein
MGDSPGPAYAHHVVCTSVGHVKGGDKLLMREVTLTPHGGVSVCTAVGSANPQHCNFGNPDENTPTYHAGKVVDEGRFRCKVLSAAMKCTVRSSGKGFRLTTQRVSRIRGRPSRRISRRKGGSRQIYFFAKPSSPVGGTGFHVHNPLVVRPKGMPLFEDGQWVLEKLRWSRWGSPVAKARGLSSSSTGDPNAAEGDRIVTWARVRLSQPGVFRGHRVYRCLRISVPPPAKYPPGCLQRLNHAVGLYKPGSGEPVGVPGGSGRALHLTDFMSPDRKVWCQIYSFATECGTEPEPPTHSAELKPNGKVSLCSVSQTEYPEGSKVPLTCFQNWPPPSDHIPVLKVGKITQNSSFRCTSSADGITCTDVAGVGKGHGFQIDKDDAVELARN